MPGDDSSSDSSSDSDTDSDDSQRGRGRKHDPSCKHHDHSHGPSGSNKRNPREVSPNAYERQPRYKSKYMQDTSFILPLFTDKAF